MSEKEKAEQQLQEAKTRGQTSRRLWRLLPYVLLALLAVAVVYGLSMGADRQRQIDALEDRAESSDTAAQEIAGAKQDQARSIRELCDSGAIEQDERGQQVCEDAATAAEEDPAEQVAAVGATGPRGPQGLPGRAGTDGKDGADGADASPAAPGRDGVDGADGVDGVDSTVPGPAGAPGADGEDGEDSTVPGPQGATGSTGADGQSVTGPQGPAGPKGDTGATGPAGKDGAPGKDSTVPGPQGPAGERGPAGADGEDGQDGRGIESIRCGDDNQWQVTYTDGESEAVSGPCRVEPDPPPSSGAPTSEASQ